MALTLRPRRKPLALRPRRKPLAQSGDSATAVRNITDREMEVLGSIVRFHENAKEDSESWINDSLA
jgi:hypothetical protein